MRKSIFGMGATALVAMVLAAGAQAQQPQAPSSAPDQQAAPADSTPGARPGLETATPPDQARAMNRPIRASWLSDRVPLQIGDLLTVIVDERTSASERVAHVGVGDRSQHATLDAIADGDVAVGKTAISTGIETDSRDIGEAGRQGDLVATISVLVTEILPTGAARIEGTKKVLVDGREQELTLSGIVRSEDVTARNLVHSSRIADAKIGYKGKKIGPKLGFIGKILWMLWP
jgi:flagellar L-ring protein FlgH